MYYLKHAFNESDDSVVARFVENPYWQYFCGFEFFQHRLPLDPTTLVKWRKRIVSKGTEKLLQGTIATAVRKEHLTPQSLERVNVDTTVQEKAIAFPTDTRLYHKARIALVKLAKERGIPDVTATAVTVPGVDIEACRRMAEGLGVPFRIRDYAEVG